jgi:hypothetical protein
VGQSNGTLIACYEQTHANSPFSTTGTLITLFRAALPSILLRQADGERPDGDGSETSSWAKKNGTC